MDNTKYMLSRDGNLRGIIKNMQSRKCKMEGCTGWRIHVVWPDGKSSYPCSKGCVHVSNDTLQIS